MASRPPRSQPVAGPPAVRFEATLGPAPHRKALEAAATLALDRLPDVDKRVRLLLTADDARRLLDEGYEVHLLAAVPVAPLAKSLVMSDAQAKASVESRLQGLRRKGGR